jgi:hypothetical protein
MGGVIVHLSSHLTEPQDGDVLTYRMGELFGVIADRGR